MTCGKRIWSRCPYTRFNKGYHYILTIIDYYVLSKYAWAVPLKTKNRNDVATVIIRDDERCPKNLQQCKCAETHEETWYQSLFDIFRKESIGCRTIQPYVEEWYVETVYAQWKLQMGWLPHLISEYNARKHRIIGMKPIDVTPAIADKLLTTMYRSHKDRPTRAV